MADGSLCTGTSYPVDFFLLNGKNAKVQLPIDSTDVGLGVNSSAFAMLNSRRLLDIKCRWRVSWLETCQDFKGEVWAADVNAEAVNS